MQGLKTINGKEVYIDSKRVKHGDEMLNEVLPIVIYDMDNSNLNYGYSSGIQFPTTSNSSINRDGLPDLSVYNGRRLTIYVKYGVDNFYIGQTLIPNVLRLQILSGYNNAQDLWMPILRLSNYNTPNWTLWYDNSFVIKNDNNIMKDTTSRKFIITKIVVE